MPDKPKQFQTVLIFLLAFVFQGVHAQNQTNNYGKEFRFAFIENYGSFEKISFAVSLEKVPTTVSISCGTYSASFLIRRLDTVFDFTKFGSPKASNFDPSRSILITANNPIALYAMNNASNSSDISAITPSERIPGNPVYYVNTYRGDESLGKANNSLFSVVAIDDSCLINIMPTADSKYNLTKNTPFTILLRKGQVYQEQAMDSQSFAGTKVWNSLGCKKFAVFEGAKCSYVDYSTPTCKGCDHLYNQSRPLQYLGKKFTTLPYFGFTLGYLYQIVATENNTSILIDGVFVKNMNQGEVYIVNQLNNVSVCIEADRPISVVELMKSGDCNGQNDNLGNPSLMTVIPDEQLTTKVGFSFPNTSNISQNPSFPAEFYIGIICPSKYLNSIRINGIAVDSGKFSKSCNMSVGSIKVNPAIGYQISSRYGFLAYMYAFGKDESYATEIGASFESQSTKMLIEPNMTSVCDSFQIFKLKAISDSSANFKWSFGDGTFFSGDSVNKSYNKSGKYKLSLSVKYPNNIGCTSDNISKIISVNTRPYFSLGKDTNVCRGIFFSLAPISKPKTTYKWSDNSSTSVYTVNNNKTVWLTMTDSNLCQFTDTVKVRFINCDTNSIIIPNVFTPGKSGETDDINDLFETRFTGFNLLSGKIYNRWGVLVYSFNYPEDSYWNGSFDNEQSRPCPDGTYFYLFQFVNSNTNFSKSFNGTVQLIR